MPKKMSREEFERLWKAVDMKSVMDAMVWILNAPKCLCEPCFQNWLKWGKQRVKDKIMSFKSYNEAVKEEKFHRKQRRISRKLDEISRKVS